MFSWIMGILLFKVRVQVSRARYDETGSDKVFYSVGHYFGS